MSIYAIADLHLGLGVDKPMDVFGSEWENHTNRLAVSWNELVSPDDWVLIPGDISWAMTTDEAALDLAFLASLPGKKLLLRGNHDYWWPSITKLRALLPAAMFALQNDAVVVDDVVVAGTRGWMLPSAQGFTQDDQRVYQRELSRLKLSLEKAADIAAKNGFECWVITHYPPLYGDTVESEFSSLLEIYGVRRCLYGHLHGESKRHAVLGELRGVQYTLVSADFLRFRPELLKE